MRGLDYGKRQKINYVSVPRHMRDIGHQICPRSASVVMLKVPEQMPELGGEGLSSKQLADKAVMGINFLKNEDTKKVASELVDMLPDKTKRKLDGIVRDMTPRAVGALQEVYDRRADIKDVISRGANIVKSVKDASGMGLGLAGTGSCCEPCGAGSDMLPGDALRKKLLAKVVRQKRMEALGDRVRTPSVGMGLNIAGTSSGQSRSKTYPGMADYDMDLGKLSGSGKKVQKGGFIILSISALIAAISAATASAMAVSVGTATVGSLVGAAATAAATTAGAVGTKKLIDKLGGKGLKDKLLEAIDNTKLTLQDLPTEAKQAILEGYEELKQEPTKEKLVKLGVKLAPFARMAFAKKVGKELGLSGSGLSLAGGANEFIKRFVGAFVGKLAK